MPYFTHDGLKFHYRRAGGGTPFVFQHGLGGDVTQPLNMFKPPPGFELLAMDCRGHGRTQPLDNPDSFTINSFADDLAAWLDHLHIGNAVVGGISMGAAVALNFAVRRPQRTVALVLVRPAWATEPNPPNLQILATVGNLIQAHGVKRGKQIFHQSERYRNTANACPDCAQSLLRQFDEPRAADAVVRLLHIPASTPVEDPAALATISTPTLVLASRQDTIHPYEMGRTLAEQIPTARLIELTPKSVDLKRYETDVQQYIGQFLCSFKRATGE